MSHGGMEFRGEHKANADLFDGLRDLLGCQVQVDAEGRENIRRATLG